MVVAAPQRARGIQFNWPTLSLLLQSPIAYHRIFAQIGGGATAGLFLSQAFYWTPRTKDPDGWFYKTSAEWEKETGLTRWEQETARKQLIKRGLIVEKKQGLPCTLHFRIVKERLISAIESLQTDETSQNQQFEEKPHTRMRENHKLDRGKTSNWIEEKPQTDEAENPIPDSITDAEFSPEITPKIISKNTYIKEEVCVFSEKLLDQDPECGQQSNLDDETNQDPIPGSRTTLLNDTETLQVANTTSHESRGFAAPIRKTSQKQEWICPGSEEEKNEFLIFKGGLLVDAKECKPVEARTVALGWANRNPEAADLLWEDWQRQKVQDANQNTVRDVVPNFHRMQPEEQASLLEKFINLGGEEFLKLSSWHKHWMQFTTIPIAKELIPGLTLQIIKQIRDALICQRV